MARKKMTREKMAVASVGQTLICAKNDKHANNEGRCRTQLAGEYRFKTRSKIGWLYSQLVDKIFMCVLIDLSYICKFRSYTKLGKCKMT